MAKCRSRVVSKTVVINEIFKKSQSITFAFLLLIGCLFFLHQVHAQESSEPYLIAMGDVGTIKGDDAIDQEKNQVKWSQLTEDQRKVLAPLGGEWDTLRPWQREKMLDIARDYPKMDAEKQLRVQKRLNRWSRMTPFERENARKRYQQFHSLSPEKKDELRKKWAEYQKLPEAERAKLRKDSPEVYYDPELD